MSKKSRKERLSKYKQRNEIKSDFGVQAKKRGRFGLYVIAGVIVLTAFLVFSRMQ